MRLFLVVALLAFAGWSLSAIGPSAAPAQGIDTTPLADRAGDGRAVLVTGASTGIGRATAELLAARGFHVYACARKQADLDALEAIDGITAVRLDVTIQAEVDAAVATVTEAGRGLYGLINNAGVVVAAPLIEVTEEDLDFQLDVNVRGPWRVTRAFAPLLIESGGRVATTGSISGVVCWGLGGPYTMSKHAVEAFTDVLALELEPLGVQVSVVEPGNYRSAIMTSMVERMKERGYTTEGSLYEDQLEGLLGSRLDRGQYKEPTEVAEAFLRALTDERAKRRYLVVPHAGEAEATLRAGLRRVVQQNAGQPYELTRDELVTMLDELLGP